MELFFRFFGHLLKPKHRICCSHIIERIMNMWIMKNSIWLKLGGDWIDRMGSI